MFENMMSTVRSKSLQKATVCFLDERLHTDGRVGAQSVDRLQILPLSRLALSEFGAQQHAAWRALEQSVKIASTGQEDEKMRFADQGVLVTGAASGIGEKVAHAIGREGAVVGVADCNEEGARRVAEAVRRAGGRAHAFVVDVTDAEAVAGCIAGASAELGRTDRQRWGRCLLHGGRGGHRPRSGTDRLLAPRPC